MRTKTTLPCTKLHSRAPAAATPCALRTHGSQLAFTSLLHFITAELKLNPLLSIYLLWLCIWLRQLPYLTVFPSFSLLVRWNYPFLHSLCYWITAAVPSACAVTRHVFIQLFWKMNREHRVPCARPKSNITEEEPNYWIQKVQFLSKLTDIFKHLMKHTSEYFQKIFSHKTKR